MNFLKVPPADPLAELTDEDILALRVPVTLPVRENNHWWEKYRISRYRWADLVAAGKADSPQWAPIKLTQDFFMVVLLRDLARMTTYPKGACQRGTAKRWHVHITKDRETGDITGVYGARRGKGDEPKTVFAHRELLGKLLPGLGDVDHANGESLDNRGIFKNKPVNLYYCPKRMQNNHNAVRRKNDGLPTGVELRKNGRYGGIRSIRLKRSGEGSVKTIRSKHTWLTPEPARQWYLNQLRRLYNRNVWAHNPTSVHFVQLPNPRPDYVRPVPVQAQFELGDTF